MRVVMRQETGDVRQRLLELGLEEEPLKDVIRRGQLAFLNCTANHPPQFPGLAGWAETVRALREYLVPLGWETTNESNYALTVDPAGRMAIVVATGNEATASAEATPSTNARKGPNTADAVAENQLQFSFMDRVVPPAASPSSPGGERRMTWVLLIHRALSEVRCELSLPSSMAEDGHIDGWRERILFGPVPLDGDLVEVVPPLLPDIAVDIRRRS
jgi:hypothetical protein